jgi:hypothetical protein
MMNIFIEQKKFIEYPLERLKDFAPSIMNILIEKTKFVENPLKRLNELSVALYSQTILPVKIGCGGRCVLKNTTLFPGGIRFHDP